MAGTVTQVWPIGTDYKVTIRGLKDDTGMGIADATVTGVLKQSNGTPVVNADSITFTVKGAGDYEALIEADAELQDGRNFTLEITAIKDDKTLFAKVTRAAAFV